MMKATALALVGAATAAAAQSLDLRLITYNIRLYTTDYLDGEAPWSERLPLMADQLNAQLDENPSTLMCHQEAMSRQLLGIQKSLNGDWTYLGSGRDGGDEGEHSPIWYQPSQWDVESDKTYWLSETPEEEGSIGWDAEFPRIVTIAKLKHKNSGTPVVFMCTHFDWKGTEAQEKSAELVVKFAGDWSDDGTPVFVGGDLNADPSSPAYKHLASKLSDVTDIIPPENQTGYDLTYTDFDDDSSNDLLLDYIFIKDPSTASLKSYDVLDNRPGDTFISDHRPVVVNVGI